MCFYKMQYGVVKNIIFPQFLFNEANEASLYEKRLPIRFGSRSLTLKSHVI